MTPNGAGIPKDGKLSVRTMRTTAEEARALGHNPMEDGVYALIEVEDSGSGIKPEHAAKIFRPFHSTKDSGKGTGLGLATSYGIVKQSGGYLFFTSKVGVGTTFRIYLPAYEPTNEDLAEMAAKERAILAPASRDVADAARSCSSKICPRCAVRSHATCANAATRSKRPRTAKTRSKF